MTFFVSFPFASGQYRLVLTGLEVSGWRGAVEQAVYPYVVCMCSDRDPQINVNNYRLP